MWQNFRKKKENSKRVYTHREFPANIYGVTVPRIIIDYGCP